MKILRWWYDSSSYMGLAYSIFWLTCNISTFIVILLNSVNQKLFKEIFYSVQIYIYIELNLSIIKPNIRPVVINWITNLMPLFPLWCLHIVFYKSYDTLKYWLAFHNSLIWSYLQYHLPSLSTFCVAMIMQSVWEYTVLYFCMLHDYIWIKHCYFNVIKFFVIL